jgi:hypothetical protein
MYASGRQWWPLDVDLLPEPFVGEWLPDQLTGDLWPVYGANLVPGQKQYVQSGLPVTEASVLTKNADGSQLLDYGTIDVADGFTRVLELTYSAERPTQDHKILQVGGGAYWLKPRPNDPGYSCDLHIVTIGTQGSAIMRVHDSDRSLRIVVSAKWFDDPGEVSAVLSLAGSIVMEIPQDDRTFSDRPFTSGTYPLKVAVPAPNPYSAVRSVVFAKWSPITVHRQMPDDAWFSAASGRSLPFQNIPTPPNRPAIWTTTSDGKTSEGLTND